MQGNRRKVRELAMGYLYQVDHKVESKTLDDALYARHFGVTENQREFFFELVRGVQEHQQELDELIQAVADNWKISRMARVDRTILRLASWELKQFPETAHQVIIDEAVEIAKKFSTTESSKFVNGILDKLVAQIRSEI